MAVPGLFVLAHLPGVRGVLRYPQSPARARLLRLDATTLIDTGLLRAYSGVKAMRSTFELLYLLVYAMVPVGAAVLAVGGPADWLPRYWAVVFAAELTCYATLPWLQTRPPRTIEAAPAPASVDALRQLNLAVLEHGSIQVNTLPSAHAAGAIAVALVIVEALPASAACSSRSPSASPWPPSSAVITTWWMRCLASRWLPWRGSWWDGGRESGSREQGAGSPERGLTRLCLPSAGCRAGPVPGHRIPDTGPTPPPAA